MRLRGCSWKPGIDHRSPQDPIRRDDIVFQRGLQRVACPFGHTAAPHIARITAYLNALGSEEFKGKARQRTDRLCDIAASLISRTAPIADLELRNSQSRGCSPAHSAKRLSFSNAPVY